MASTPASVFETSLDKTNLILKDIEQAYGWSKDRRHQSYAAMRTVLHLLRDRLPVQESVEFAAQLPVLIRGIYFEGWDPSLVPIKLNREEFLFEVRQGFPLEVEGGVENLVRTVLNALRRHITEGEWDDIRSNVPKDLSTIIP
ncbi:DUF2267 domain-containing protein [Micromonospora sonneratiae]|jgi:uncharacterized protein (DUF2267 family)|uniref:DUF2267 domain-containing protein n=1 Tax=Micromonospora sonneratiae TaxID=1184706 RepID=A0ABW3YEL5_9ACTN